MALNPFFLHGSASEQRLVQDLINEQLKMYGVEVTYIPRKFVRRQTIIEELQSSLFDDNYSIEAYVQTYEGYSGSGDILTKFGVNIRDELSIIISKERFEDFISPLLRAGNSDEITGESTDEATLLTRPKEGDLIYFPLGGRLFEVKFVEHEQPFYQLGKTYVYELKCELFEYEDEVIDTSIEDIDTKVQDQGYTSTLIMTGVGRTSVASAIIGSGYVNKIYLNNDGYGYTSSPTVQFSPSPTGETAAGIVRIVNKGNSFSVKDILLINAGTGYTISPTITISGGGGTGAAATCSIEKNQNGIVKIIMNDGGAGYSTAPIVSINGSIGAGETATGISSVGNNQQITSVFISNPGIGYTSTPTITIDNPPLLSGFGNYKFNEIVIGSRSNTRARVKEWDWDTKILKVSHVGITQSTSGFFNGEIIVGTSSSARYSVKTYDKMDLYDKYSQNDEIEEEADSIIDFSQSNPFGSF
jgi:hypothetical protein